MAAHSGILAWEIPWTEEPTGLQSMGFKTVGHHRATDHTHTHTHTHTQDIYYVKAHLLLLLSRFSRVRPTLCDPIDGSPPGSPVPGILQVRTLEWVAISFSNA